VQLREQDEQWSSCCAVQLLTRAAERGSEQLREQDEQ
jgi:hypothetical protein